MIPIDIIITTRTTRDRPERLGYLKQCLSRLAEYTRAPCKITVIDDASDPGLGVQKYLNDMKRYGVIHEYIAREERWGQRANLNLGFELSQSDPIIFTDDDVLCPNVNPSWLRQILHAFKNYPEFGLIALNSPGKNYIRTDQGGARGAIRKVGPITESRALPGHMVGTRRVVLEGWSYKTHKGQDIRQGGYFPDSQRCGRAQDVGLRVGYLTETFCFHCGDIPVRADKPTETILEPEDWDTLRPPEKWAW